MRRRWSSLCALALLTAGLTQPAPARASSEADIASLEVLGYALLAYTIVALPFVVLVAADASKDDPPETRKPPKPRPPRGTIDRGKPGFRPRNDAEAMLLPATDGVALSVRVRF